MGMAHKEILKYSQLWVNGRGAPAVLGAKDFQQLYEMGMHQI